MEIFKNFNRNKWLYNGLIGTFIILYAVTAFVSFYHAIAFFNIANAIWLSVLLSFVAEVGQASVLFGILLTENKSKFLPWVIMFILTTLQVIGNVVSSFDWIIAHNDAGLDGFKRSILFFVQAEDSEMFRVIIAWISGALLPVIALSMTALVAQNIQLRDEKKTNNVPIPEFSGSTIPQEGVIDAKDIISEISKIRPTEEDIEKMENFLKHKVPIIKVPTEEEELAEKKSEGGVPFDDPIIDISSKPVEEKEPEVDKKIVQEAIEQDEPEEPLEPDESEDDEFGPVDLTDEVPDIIPEGVAETIKSEASELAEILNPKETDDLDEEVERLSPEVTISHNNGLVEKVTPKSQEEKVEEPIVQDTEQVIEEVIPETPSPTPSESPLHTERLSDEQLERIRQIARDNLKKK